MASEALAGRRPWVVVWVVTWPLLITYLTQKVLTTVDTALLGRFSTSAPGIFLAGIAWWLGALLGLVECDLAPSGLHGHRELTPGARCRPPLATTPAARGKHERAHDKN